jgi:type VI protein secretion system component Hcp
MDAKENSQKISSELSQDSLNDVAGGAPNVSEIVVTKQVDQASPKLFTQSAAPTTGSVETLGERELNQVVGGAYEADMTIEGTKQGKFKGE